MKNTVIDKFKREYEELSENVPPDLWERLEADLDSTSTEKPIAKKSIPFYKYAAVLLVFLSLGLYFFISQKESVKSSDNIVIGQEKINRENPEEKSMEAVALKSEEKQKADINMESVVDASSSNQIEKMALNHPISSAKKSIEKTDSPKIESKTQAEAPFNLAQNKEVTEKVKYTSAEDLLFGYELEKTNAELDKRGNKLGNLELKKPKEISILGVKIYSEETPNE
ncbi:hypothetical protein [Kaistella carnis]|uniref:hypothetical protein n=1 Tax=Kaistella carnis TaxID=1241979 RepID=UPI0028AF5487|nr:hypothetical protein [Kaistella carnis]